MSSLNAICHLAFSTMHLPFFLIHDFNFRIKQIQKQCFSAVYIVIYNFISHTTAIHFKLLVFGGRLCYRRNHAPASHTKILLENLLKYLQESVSGGQHVSYTTYVCVLFFSFSLPLHFQQHKGYTLYILMFWHNIHATSLPHKVHCVRMTHRRYARKLKEKEFCTYQK